MSERLLPTLLLACAAIAAPVQGQSLPELQRREAELTARLATLHAELATSVERRFTDQPRRAVSSGPLILAFPSTIDDGADDALRAVLDSQRTRYGNAIDQLVSDTLFVGVEDQGTGPGGRAPVGWWQLGPIRGERDVTRRDPGDGRWVAPIVGVAFQKWAEELLAVDLRAWLGAIDNRATVATLRDPLVRDLVTSPSSRARRCLSGAATDCRLLLELGEGDTPRLEAYDREDLPGLIGRMDLDLRIPGRANCVGKRDPAACAELVRQGRVIPSHPVSPRTRQSLFAYALVSGGESAWLRLHEARGRSIPAQLSAAAGRPLDSLLVEWQHDLRAGRRTTTAGLAPSLLLAVVWSVLTTLFFAWRYRWRHV